MFKVSTLAASSRHSYHTQVWWSQLPVQPECLLDAD